MNHIYKEKRNNAFFVWVALWLISSFCYGLMIASPDEHPLKGAASLGYIVSFLMQIKSWFNAFTYWSKAKGKSGWYGLVGLLGPFGLPVLYFMKDNGITPYDLDDPILKCPHCDSEYKKSEYDLSNGNIYCSYCKKELIN